MTFRICLQLSPALKSAIGNDSQRNRRKLIAIAANKQRIACALWTNNNNRKISNFVHLLVCGDINLGCICFENYFSPSKFEIILYKTKDATARKCTSFTGIQIRLKWENEL